MTERVNPNGAGDAEELARVAALVARAGLRLPADQIAGLVTAYRSDRAGFERLRAMLATGGETAHPFRATRPVGEAS